MVSLCLTPPWPSSLSLLRKTPTESAVLCFEVTLVMLTPSSQKGTDWLALAASRLRRPTKWYKWNEHGYCWDVLGLPQPTSISKNPGVLITEHSRHNYTSQTIETWGTTDRNADATAQTRLLLRTRASCPGKTWTTTRRPHVEACCGS